MPTTSSMQSHEEVLAAVRSSQGCSFGCNKRTVSTRQSSADTAGTAGCGSSIVAASSQPTPGRMQSASSAGWDQLERVLSGLASLDALLPSCEHPDFTVTAIPSSTHQQRANEPAIGIPALCAAWPGSKPPNLKSCASCRDCSSASGGAGCSGGTHNSSDAAYKDSNSSSGRFWLLSLKPRPKAPPAGTGGGGCHSDAVSAEAAASLEYLCPGDLDVQLGPLLGVGGSGRTYRGLWLAAQSP
ncbi:hypothetical protein D9Q98_005824 [Chlorella vulgaris]|uniref:Uncharacterized protein n=1 Tax=Chlorella vulgaris TaxID=3077 RepID=A0A9D4TWJ4_CHLVU|nr:hypothetical protein D9Q98_005824 [Chlorella vulgaris]